jgi:hypothetical protein
MQSETLVDKEEGDRGGRVGDWKGWSWSRRSPTGGRTQRGETEVGRQRVGAGMQGTEGYV